MTPSKARIEGYYCVHCKSPLRSEKTLCSACRGVYYCSENCQRIHWRQNHKIACQLYKHILAKSTLADQELTFPLRVHPEKLDEWLTDLGVLNKGMWMREGDMSASYAYGQLPPTDGSVSAEWGLPLEKLPAPLCKPLADPLVEFPTEVLKSWGDYYRFRGIPLDSPVAVLLSLPLTIYHVLSTILKDHKRIRGKTELEIFLIGVDKEIDQLWALCELAHLIPDVQFHFLLVGESISSDFKYDSPEPRCKFTARRGLYHKLKGLAKQPDMAILPNANLEANSHFRETLSVLREQRVPTFVTELTETSTLNATRMFSSVGSTEAFQVRLNPFRSPVWVEVSVHAMPWHSNGYLQAVNI